MKAKKKKLKLSTMVKTLSCFTKEEHNNILNEMTFQSKNVYNFMIFCITIYYKYKERIYKEIYDNIDTFNSTEEVYDKINKCYKKYFEQYKKEQSIKKKYNDMIYKWVHDKLINITLINSNLVKVRKNIISQYFKKFTIPVSDIKECTNIINDIVNSVYIRNFFSTKRAMMNNEPLKITDKQFIDEVKNDKFLLKVSYDNNKYKDKVLSHTLFTIHDKKHKDKQYIQSDQNLITRFMYSNIPDKTILPSDLVNNIGTSAFKGFVSYWKRKEKGHSNNKIPKYLEKDGRYILPFSKRSHKIVEIDKKEYVRLTVGSNIANNYIKISKNNDLICIHSKGMYKKYVDKKYMKPIVKGVKGITQKKYYKLNDQYIDKNNKNIIDSYYLYFPIPEKILFEDIKYVEIIPLYNGQRFKINFVYNSIVPNPSIKSGDISVDLGMVNIMSIYEPSGVPYIISGSSINRLNTHYNDRIAQLQKNKRSQKFINRIWVKRSNKLDDYFNKIVKWFYNKYQDKKRVILGYNKGWKTGVNLGKKTNRKFYQIPYRRLLSKLKMKLEYNGIELVTTEESYTSKCDALSLEPIQYHKKYLGERVKRGLFKSGTGRIINADINGAINIMRKYYKRIKKTFILQNNPKIFNPIKIKSIAEAL